ncbi:DUF761 domain protein [Senna tora]|uniref:DUF761 domain protein n=1 Tax=Senna tora TaxID=362788 RepID=A0A835CE30_9FABA|nr:DUF761 domain protein [Senna tora]
MRDDELGLGIGCLLGDLGGSVEGVGGGDGGAEVGGGEEGEDELGAVLEEEHDDVALADAEGVEAGGDAAGGEVDLGVGEGVAGGGIDEAGTVVELGDVFEAVGVEWEVGWDNNPGSGRAGIEEVIRGKFGVKGFSRFIGMASIIFAELVAVRFGLELARHMGLYSQSVISSLMEKQSVLRRLRRAVHRVRFLLSSVVLGRAWQMASVLRRASGLSRRQLSFNDIGSPSRGLMICTAERQDSIGGISEDSGCSPRGVVRTWSSVSQEEDDINERAEMFINNFRRQLRIERQISLQLRYGKTTSSDRISP